MKVRKHRSGTDFLFQNDNHHQNTEGQRRQQERIEEIHQARSLNRREIKTTEEWVYAVLMVPGEYAAVLAKPGFCAPIKSGSAGSLRDRHRIEQWNNKTRMTYGWTPSRRSHLEAILKMDLDTKLTFAIPGNEWVFIESVCKALKISTCDWLLASVQYDAQLAMEETSKA